MGVLGDTMQQLHARTFLDMVQTSTHPLVPLVVLLLTCAVAVEHHCAPLAVVHLLFSRLVLETLPTAVGYAREAHKVDQVIVRSRLFVVVQRELHSLQQAVACHLHTGKGNAFYLHNHPCFTLSKTPLPVLQDW